MRYQCTWSKYSSSAGRTVSYYGEGYGSSAAKAAAVQACLDSGAWRGWFCGSGSITCSRS